MYVKKSGELPTSYEIDAEQPTGFLKPRLASMTAPNPLQEFPLREDTVNKVFCGLSPSKSRRKNRKLEPLSNDSEKPSGTNKERYIQRRFKKFESSVLFSAADARTAHYGEVDKLNMKSLDKKFILIEETRLAELTKFENILREEKQILGDKYTWVLSDVQLNARIPIPATRLAVRNMCEQQMKKVRADLVILLLLLSLLLLSLSSLL